MADFLSNALGSGGIAKIAGQKAGELVEETVKKVMGGEGEKTEQKEGGGAGGGGGFDVGDALSLVGGKKDENKGGFDVGDALSLVGGKKDDGKGDGGIDVQNVIGGFFK